MAAIVLTHNSTNAQMWAANRACYSMLSDLTIGAYSFEDCYPSPDIKDFTLFFYFLVHHGREYNVRWFSSNVKSAYYKWLVKDDWILYCPSSNYSPENDKKKYHHITWSDSDSEEFVYEY